MAEKRADDINLLGIQVSKLWTATTAGFGALPTQVAARGPPWTQRVPWYPAIRAWGSSSHRKAIQDAFLPGKLGPATPPFRARWHRALSTPRPPRRLSPVTAVSMGYVRLPGTQFGPPGGRFSIREVPGADVPAADLVAFGGGFQAAHPVGTFEIHPKGVDQATSSTSLAAFRTSMGCL